MPNLAPDPLTSRILSVWLVNPFDDIPGEGLPPLRYWSLARVLAARGHDVTWWSANWSHRRKAIRTAPFGIQEDEGFAVRLVAVRPYQKNVSLARLGSHRDFGKTFERLANEVILSGQLERPDIILASLPPLEGPEAALRLSKSLDATFVLDAMDLWPETFERLVPGPAILRRLLMPLLVGSMSARRKALVTEADALSAATQTYANVSFAAASSETPRHVCYVGAYAEEFPEPTQALDRVPSDDAQEGSPNENGIECVYAGTLEAGQDLEALVAAARQLSAKGLKGTIHVAGTGKHEASVRRAASGASGSFALRIHGLLPRAEYVRLLSQCDAGLVCVKPETAVAMPYKACDYAAAGLALVNALPGELQGLIDRYEAGLAYRAGDPNSLTQAIAALAGDPRQLRSMRQGARRLALAEFDREKTYLAFADWIETVHGDR